IDCLVPWQRTGIQLVYITEEGPAGTPHAAVSHYSKHGTKIHASSLFSVFPCSRRAAKNYGGVYNIHGWGDPYFAVNKHGHLCVRPHGRGTAPGQEIDLVSVIHQAAATTTTDDHDDKEKWKLQFPMILRFPDVLRHRLDSLHAAFAAAVEHTGYRSVYQGVFPVKVSQNKAVVQDMVRFGHEYGYGLEAGSKPELLIAMSCLTKAKPGAYLVCNGYKDKDYVALALAARAMGLNAIIVLGMEEELDIVVEQSIRLGVELAIGVRAKLLTKIPGHFGSTAGKASMHGKFGLLAERIYDVARKLKGMGKLHWLKLLHFHVGSMIPSTDIVLRAASEAAGIYCGLLNDCGAEAMATLDCGGGLGVDYDGTRSGSSDMSVAYGLEEYASSIVQAVRLRCDDNGVPHPVLCTESGRAMASHHSMIILEALSAIPEPRDDGETIEQLHAMIHELASKQQPSALLKGDAAAAGIKKHGIEMYKLGKKLSKSVMADTTTIYNYHMNLSVFSLVSDFWGNRQLFPMMPVSRLHERPTRMAMLVDLTCDSDGRIEKFIGGAETLPLHPLDPVLGGYYVAVLLAGAYQEALSSKHNLLGGPSLVRVLGGGDGGFILDTTHLGPTTEELIGTMRYDVKEDIAGVIEERAREKQVWEMVGTLVENGLYTMPYLVDY
ncbi:LOW QUALITY PROTEIN: arginine decarboxylase-like, partial [Hordeum vulgare subsp. vulgare]|uniref:LOW QUALITY PROTEIN: arginine decarboxylase-like n=1 Tax=Hordeum vulgare subsp. vulgare TaxID=112509 RepID=UPI001D1A5823